MFFNDILDVHDSYQSKESHADILGDGFLLESNQVYRKIKLGSLTIGCQYIEAYPEYLLLPFHELPQIVKRKQIPYIPSARLMKNVELSQPGAFSTDDMPMPKSFHLHEAAHVIADHHLKAVAEDSLQEKILKSILAESFANTVDALACTAAVDDLHHFFIQQNSYMQPQQKIMKAMNDLTDAVGFRFLFSLTFFTYVHANFLTKPLTQKFIGELAAGAKMSPKTTKNIEIVCDIGEKLDPQFRYTTTSNYFKQQGIEGDIQDLLDFPFMKFFASRPEFAKAVDALCDTISSP